MNVHLLKLKLLLGKDDIDEFINFKKIRNSSELCMCILDRNINVFKFSSENYTEIISMIVA